MIRSDGASVTSLTSASCSNLPLSPPTSFILALSKPT